MTPSLTPLDSILVEIILVTLAVGLPVMIVLAARFLWDRNVNLGRSKELDKLTWQLHRIASAMEHQMNLSFPPVQPGTEEPRDLAYLQKQQQPAAQAPAASSIAAPVAAPRPTSQPAPVQPVAVQPVAQQQVTPPPQEEPDAPLPPLERRDPNVEAPRAGVNSMFGL